MKLLLFPLLLLLGTHGACARIHSLKYFYTASSHVTNFPEFVSVGLVDGVEISRYDSNTRREEPKQDWMMKISDPHYWEEETQIGLDNQQVFKVNIEIVRQRFNKTEGVHVFQYMSGCEWDDETGEVVDGYDQYAFDGEDFLAFDLKTETYVAPSPQAFITKMKWDNDKLDIEHHKRYITEECPEWLKIHLENGKSSLQRTELPSVSLLQKSPSSPVTCHATGFYPNGAMLFWRKEGEELHEGVETGETLPNHDGTFQLSSRLQVSSVAPEDWGKYECVFQLAGVEEDLVTVLDPDAILSNRAKPVHSSIFIMAAAALVLILAVVAFLIWRKNKEAPPPPPAGARAEEQKELRSRGVGGAEEQEEQEELRSRRS